MSSCPVAASHTSTSLSWATAGGRHQGTTRGQGNPPCKAAPLASSSPVLPSSTRHLARPCIPLKRCQQQAVVVWVDLQQAPPQSSLSHVTTSAPSATAQSSRRTAAARAHCRRKLQGRGRRGVLSVKSRRAKRDAERRKTCGVASSTKTRDVGQRATSSTLRMRGRRMGLHKPAVIGFNPAIIVKQL